MRPSARTTGANASAIANSRSPVVASDATTFSLRAVCREPAKTFPSSEYHWYAGNACTVAPVDADAVRTLEKSAVAYATSGGGPADAGDAAANVATASIAARSVAFGGRVIGRRVCHTRNGTTAATVAGAVTAKDAMPLVKPRDRAAWRRWLEAHHATDGPVWLALVKKGSEAAGVTYEEGVLEALCFGWIDSTAGRIDDDHYKVWMGARKLGSGWSAVNKRRIERLIDDGAMAPAGLAAIEAAKADGTWAKLDASHSLQVPKDLAAAFRRYPGSKSGSTGSRRRRAG